MVDWWINRDFPFEFINCSPAIYICVTIPEFLFHFNTSALKLRDFLVVFLGRDSICSEHVELLEMHLYLMMMKGGSAYHLLTENSFERD
jgi:hypothetical protein